jgi:hypothetical protein
MENMDSTVIATSLATAVFLRLPLNAGHQLIRAPEPVSVCRRALGDRK